MAKKKYYTRDEIHDWGTKVRTKKGSEYGHWAKYVGTVIGFRWREDGGIDYRVRAWRTNQHWWPAECLELVPDEELCAECKKPKHRHCCAGCCHG